MVGVFNSKYARLDWARVNQYPPVVDEGLFWLLFGDELNPHVNPPVDDMWMRPSWLFWDDLNPPDVGFFCFFFLFFSPD